MNAETQRHPRKDRREKPVTAVISSAFSRRLCVLAFIPVVGGEVTEIAAHASFRQQEVGR
jgi:hypothetical protein